MLLPPAVSFVVRGIVGDLVIVGTRAGDMHLANLGYQCASRTSGAHGGPAFQGVEEVGGLMEQPCQRV
eukprot:756479-Lingulodinium_polyedra.AAC.1